MKNYINLKVPAYLDRHIDKAFVVKVIKDRPFNLQGGYVFFSPVFNNRLYVKNSESGYFFFPPPKSEYFFSNIENQNVFFRKIAHSPPSS
jgi:hypothetical protein